MSNDLNRKIYEKISYNDGSIYEGETKDGKKYGKGRINYKDGSYYYGEWKNDKREGKGTMKYCKGNKLNIDFYYGDWICDSKHGIGTLILLDGRVFRGCWKHNKLLGLPFN